MILFKCKICGGNLEVDGNTNIASCQYCGSTMTIPRLDDERRINLYDRAGHFRRGGEFDKAISIYERILEEDQTDAEAYWSLVLCKYGIEYVEDPATKQYTPTCNRAQLTSIFADEDYKAAIRYAPPSAKSIYEAEAQVIDNVVKGIVEISSHEKPFDIFICYKESDANGRRTPDSVLAQELYHNLVKEGFHVFFSRITLESKLGTEYEPYIFAALNSAPVMVAIGTKPEYFQAPWVKNEWSRYLSSIKSGAQKTLIPAYRDMDPYDLPEDFSHLQAQDMGKLGFMQDLIHGIKKLTGTKQGPSPVQLAPEALNVDALLERAYLNLEYAEWQKADDALERYLDHHPKSAKAHVGKLMRELRICHESELAEQDQSFHEKVHYQKAVRFADDAYRAVLEGYANAVLKNQQQKELERKYHAARNSKSIANTSASFLYAARAFQAISGHWDADAQAEDCIKRAKEMDARRRAYAEQRRIEEEKKREQQKKRTKIVAVCTLAAIVLICLIAVFVKIGSVKSEQKQLYHTAVSNLENGNHLLAAEQFFKLGGYKDSKDKVLESYSLLDASAGNSTIKDYQRAIGICNELGNYKDAAEQRIQLMYDLAQFLLSTNQPELALGYLGRTLDYKDAKQQYITLSRQLHSIAVGDDFALIVNNNGEALLRKETSEQIAATSKLGSWSNVIWVDANETACVGLKTDGKLLVYGSIQHPYDKITEWEDIIAISVVYGCIVGLKSDGSLIASGRYAESFQTEAFTDIVSIAVYESNLMAIKADGTVVTSFDVGDGEKYWEDVVSISAGERQLAALTSEGTLYTYHDSIGYYNSNEKTIVMGKAIGHHTFLLAKDGTVIVVGYGPSSYPSLPNLSIFHAGDFDLIGFKPDGALFSYNYEIDDILQAETIPYWDYVANSK